MSRPLWTVVAWSVDDVRVRPVGPTSNERVLLRGTLDAARARYAGAAIVEWERRDDAVAEVAS